MTFFWQISVGARLLIRIDRNYAESLPLPLRLVTVWYPNVRIRYHSQEVNTNMFGIKALVKTVTGNYNYVRIC